MSKLTLNISDLVNLTELRNWTIFAIAIVGATITIKTYVNSVKQRKLDNTFKTLDFIRRHIEKQQIEKFIELFQANNELTGVKFNEFIFSDGRVENIEYMFSEGGCGNGDIHNMIELFNLLSPTFKKLEIDIIWYEYGQIMHKLYDWTKYLEQTENERNKTSIPTFYQNFNAFMKGNWPKRLIYKPTKYYTYAE